MKETSPLIEAQQKFVDTLKAGTLAEESVGLEQALNRTTARDVLAGMDSPPYSRAIVEGFLVNTADTKAASDDAPLSFSVKRQVLPGDDHCPVPATNEGIQVATGSLVAAGGPFSIIRMWDAEIDAANKSFSIKRPFPPFFFIEQQGCDVKKDSIVAAKGSVVTPKLIGTFASLGISKIAVKKKPIVTVFASGDEVIPYTHEMRPGAIYDCNSIMLASAIEQAQGIPKLGGIMTDDFEEFVAAMTIALANSDMIVIYGGTAVGGRDFISDLIKEVGELVVDGVPMRSGRPLIMGVSKNKPIVCVAGHPPEALRGFELFGVAAINCLTGKTAELPADPSPPPPPQ